MIITSSEIQDYQSCLRKWMYRSANMMSLQRVGRKQAALFIGSLAHKGLETALDGDANGAADAIDIMASEAQTEAEAQYKLDVGVGWSDEERATFTAEQDLATGLVAHHNVYYGDRPLAPLTCKGTELGFKVAIPGTSHHLAGTFDALATDISGDIWIVDHKTFTTQPTMLQLEMSWQFRGYIFAAQQLFPTTRIGGVLYNGLKKAIPSTPETLKNGSLSKAKNKLASCTAETFLAAIEKHGLNPNDYAVEIQWLRDRGNTFFKRMWIHSNVCRQEAFLADLATVANSMNDHNLRFGRFPPTFRYDGYTGCAGCSVRDLCEARENMEPPPLHLYEEGTYATTAALILEPSKVSTISDLAKLNGAQHDQ